MDSKLKALVKQCLQKMDKSTEISTNEWLFAREVALDDAYGNRLCMAEPVDSEYFAKTMAISICFHRKSRREAETYVHTTDQSPGGRSV